MIDVFKGNILSIILSKIKAGLTQPFISTNKNASYGKEKAAQRAKTAFSKCVFWVT